MHELVREGEQGFCNITGYTGGCICLPRTSAASLLPPPNATTRAACQEVQCVS
jgi:hypothetical protein